MVVKNGYYRKKKLFFHLLLISFIFIFYIRNKNKKISIKSIKEESLLKNENNKLDISYGTDLSGEVIKKALLELIRNNLIESMETVITHSLQEFKDSLYKEKNILYNKNGISQNYNFNVVTLFDDNVENIMNYLNNIILIHYFKPETFFYVIDMGLNENISEIINNIVSNLNIQNLNVITRKKNKYNYPLEKNYIINILEKEYTLFLDSNINIKDITFIDNLVSNINKETKCVGYFCDKIKYNSVISTQPLLDKEIDIPINCTDMFINHKCCLFETEILSKFKFDKNITPFFFEDLEFMLNFNKKYKTKKSITN